LEAICRWLPKLGRAPHWVRLYDRIAPDAPAIIRAIPKLQTHCVLLVDGGELLIARHFDALMGKVGKAGLVVTAHADCVLPTLVRTHTDDALLLRLLQLLVPGDAEAIFPIAQDLLAQHAGDIRAVFRDLYDLTATGDVTVDARNCDFSRTNRR
jgi:hypothetical protein